MNNKTNNNFLEKNRKEQNLLKYEIVFQLVIRNNLKGLEYMTLYS